MGLRTATKEYYKGYSIVLYNNTVHYTSFYCIHDGNERLSAMALASPKAAKNVIDTHIRATKL